MKISRWLAAASVVLVIASATVARAAPANDNFASAKSVVKIPWSETRNTLGATRQKGEPVSTCGDSVATVWYKVKATQQGPIGVSTFGSTFDTSIAVYTGSTLPKLKQVICSDDAGTRRQSMLGWVADAGVTYYIQAGTGLIGNPGRLTIRIAYGVKLDGKNVVPFPLFAFYFPYAIAAVADPNEVELAGRVGAGICTGQSCFAFDVFDIDAERTTTGGGRANVCYNVFLSTACYPAALP